MQFSMTVRNFATGEEKNFLDKQALADFLATQDSAEDWTGHDAYGELPAPTGTAEPVAEPTEPVAQPEALETPEV